MLRDAKVDMKMSLAHSIMHMKVYNKVSRVSHDVYVHSKRIHNGLQGHTSAAFTSRMEMKETTQLKRNFVH